MKEVKLLLIDDNEADYELIKQKLKKVNHTQFHITWSNSISEGKKQINDDEYDLILLDTFLNDGNGIELLHYARQNNNQKPIIIITGIDSIENDLAASSYGADDYVVKSDLNDSSLERSIRYTLEKHKAQLVISQREKRYRKLFEKSFDPIAVLDTNFTIVEVNQSMANLMEIPQDKIVSRPLSDFFSEDKDYSGFTETMKEWGVVKQYSASLQFDAETAIPTRISSITLFDIHNQTSGYQIIIQDLSQEHINEQRLIRAEKLGMTGRMARSIAHEIRNPLTNINIAFEQLKVTHPDISSSQMYFDIVDRGAKQINKLITELLNSSKPTVLQFMVKPITEVLKEAIDLAIDRISLNKVKLIQNFEVESNVKVDIAALKTAFLNIIINAVEALTEKGPKLSISTKDLINEVQVIIADNGIGMSKDQLNKLFDPFFTGKAKGMGLGMTSTQNIIQQHNGHIDVESKEGKGTTFYISLPKAILN